MNKYKLTALIIAAFLAGDAEAIARANRKIRETRRNHKKQLVTAERNAFHDGYDAAIKSPVTVRLAYKRLFPDTPAQTEN